LFVQVSTFNYCLENLFQVAYLSLSSWNDSRQENEDRMRSSGKRPGARKAPAMKTAGSSSEDDEPKRKKAGAAATPKGFGRK